jgi:hypothetical protein
MKKTIQNDERVEFINKIKIRFENNMHRHKNIKFDDYLNKLTSSDDKIFVVYQMELTGGEPDVIDYDKDTNLYTVIDCSKESPIGRRSVCYDQEALEARKNYKPENSAIEMANQIGIELLDESQYHHLQKYGPFDTKTSSWLKTPNEIRSLGGAFFGDHRYGKTFIYHNGADSYYGVRGFRGFLKI